MQFEQAGQFIINKLNDELPGGLTYHNINHTLDVHRAAELLGTAEDIDDEEMKLLLTAALFHDAGFLIKVQGHEEESCRIAGEILPGFKYTNDDINKICGMIMATKLPQSPKTNLERILADADLDYLGRDDFFDIGGKLFNELHAAGAIGSEFEWNESQLHFMENHSYFTKTAINLRQEKKADNMAKIKAQPIDKLIK